MTANGDGAAPDASETPLQRARYDTARQDFDASRKRFEGATHRLDTSRQRFHDLETAFLDVIEELRRTDLQQIRNIARLEGLRLQLTNAFDQGYRSALDELVSAAMSSIGANRDGGSDGNQTG